MKTLASLVSVSALTLIANLAVAVDIYGGFANTNLVSTASNDPVPATRAHTPSGARVSLADFYQGNPDVSRVTVENARYAESNPGIPGQSIPYDALVQGNPDIDTGAGMVVEKAPWSGDAQAYAARY
jgi:hypothetical protein